MTPLVRVASLERAHGITSLYIKLENLNRTGSHKDRAARAHVLDALKRGYNQITTASSGNFGVAIASAAAEYHLDAVIFVPTGYEAPRVREMHELGAKVVRTEGHYEEAVKISRLKAKSEGMYDANPGSEFKEFQILSYAPIAEEILSQLSFTPDVVAIPVSNGTVLAGVFEGFKRVSRNLPKLVAGSTLNFNPVVNALRLGLEKVSDLSPTEIKETLVNEPLVNYHSFDGEEAFRAVRESGGWGVGVTDSELVQMAKWLFQEEEINALPAATAGVCAIVKSEECRGKRCVALLTARG